jgi:hypothetical protein
MFHIGGPATPLDCLLAVYTGASVGALTRVAADSGTWAGNSCTARFTATAGATYRIAVDGDGGDEMTFVLFWNSGPPPPHDDAADARQITGFSGVLDDTNRGATDELAEPRHAPDRAGSSVWYRWTAPDDGEATFHIQSPYLYQPAVYSEHNKRIAVFTGTPPDGLTLRADSSHTPRTTGPWPTRAASPGAPRCGSRSPGPTSKRRITSSTGGCGRIRTTSSPSRPRCHRPAASRQTPPAPPRSRASRRTAATQHAVRSGSPGPRPSRGG